MFVSSTALWVAIHCTAIVHSNGSRNGWNWIMSSRASPDAPSPSEWRTNSSCRRRPTNSSAKRKSVMRFCRNATLAIHSRARTTLSVRWRMSDSMNVAALQATTVNTANTWLMLATEIRAAITEPAPCWKKVALAANACRDTKAPDVKSILTTAMTTNAKTMEHALTASSRTLAVVCRASPASFARRKSSSAEVNLIRVQTAPNVSTTSHITHASVHRVSVASIAPTTSTTARITCVKTADLALTASMTTFASVRATSPESSARAHRWWRWCIRRHRPAKIMNANLASASSRIRRRLTTFVNALQATPESVANI